MLIFLTLNYAVGEHPQTIKAIKIDLNYQKHGLYDTSFKVLLYTNAEQSRLNEGTILPLRCNN